MRGRDAEVLCIGSEQDAAEFVECHEAEAPFAFEGIERVGLQVGVFRRLACSGQVAGELPHVAALTDLVGVPSPLSCRGEEAGGGDVLHAVFDEEYLAVLRGVPGYLGQCSVDVGLSDGE